ncbi:MAG TPA: glycoside hydrolase family 2 TIM barrel-domain containing protein [Bacteroidales bacterium]|nr:glycoside hydrolase family 2 TIM barrel-domain containing protein [Bacteroidales bacterium]
MRTLLLSFYLLLVFTGCSQNNRTAIPIGSEEPRTQLLFDDEWKFFRGDTSGAENSGFDDSSWRSLDLPHDWSIEDLPGKDTPIDSGAAGGLDAGYLVGGTGWYRKTFVMPEYTKGQRCQIQFDGIYMNSDVWLNGKHLGNHPYGYTSFRYDITGDLMPGRENVLAVRVRNEGHNSRWYTGSGIYRHVWLTVTGTVHLDPWSTFISSSYDGAQSKVSSVSGIYNDSGEDIETVYVTRILDKSGSEIVKAETRLTIPANSSSEVSTQPVVASPELWSPETPVLYKVVNELHDVNGKVLDKLETSFGIRTVEINSTEGFLLNGEPLELRGGCMHHDNGPLGAAAFDRAEERRVELMKEAGFNAIRCSHNPPSPAFLDACDRLGMLVIDESFDMWTEQKNPDDYHLYFREWWQRDVESMVRRDRNHPSIVLWSIGNEIPERGKPEGAELAKLQVNFIRQLDSTRMITSAVNSLAPDKDPYFAELDVAGYNYAVDKYVPDHKRLPGRIIISTESFPLEAFKYWKAAEDLPYVIGDFVWTGFDYLGEASIGWLGYPHNRSFFPWTHAYCGDIDICGFKRPQSFYRDVLWKENQVSIFVKPPVPSFPLNPEKAEWSKWEWQDVVRHWNWKGYEGKPLQIEVYSSCDEVELFLNDVSLGRKKTGRETEFIARWNVPYKEGLLAARGYKGKEQVALSELQTAGKPSSLKLWADRQNIKAGGQDLSYVTVELLDKDGFRNPIANVPVKFSLEGPGIIQAVGSSNPIGTESFTKPWRNTYQGRCLVIIRSAKEAGEIILHATSETGSSEIRINSAL